MLDVTVLFLEHGHASTATGPLEVFRDAGVLWQVLQHQPAEPRFRVRSASIGGRAVRPDAPYTIQPDLSLDQVGATAAGGSAFYETGRNSVNSGLK